MIIEDERTPIDIESQSELNETAYISERYVQCQSPTFQSLLASLNEAQDNAAYLRLRNDFVEHLWKHHRTDQ
ncbi:unnamed protein product [Aphanomyces euteiches]